MIQSATRWLQNLKPKVYSDLPFIFFFTPILILTYFNILVFAYIILKTIFALELIKQNYYVLHLFYRRSIDSVNFYQRITK